MLDRESGEDESGPLPSAQRSQDDPEETAGSNGDVQEDGLRTAAGASIVLSGMPRPSPRARARESERRCHKVNMRQALE